MPAILERSVQLESPAVTVFRELVGVNLEDRAQVRRLIPPRGKPWRSIPLVNAYELEARCEWLSRRSIKKESKLFALRLAVAMCDLTTLEGQDTVEKVRRLCARAVNPYTPREGMPPREVARVPHVAAVCVYPQFIAVAKEALQGTGVKVAAVGTAFPSGQYPFHLRLADVKWAIREGADEVDMVLNRGLFLQGEYRRVFDEIARVKTVCGDRVHLKVILETGELGSYDNIRKAAYIAHDGRSRLHQDQYGQDPTRRNASCHTRDARSHPRLLRRDRARRGHEARRGYPHRQRRHPLSGAACTRRSEPTGSLPNASASVPARCSMTCWRKSSSRSQEPTVPATNSPMTNPPRAGEAR
jgi:deoxyribose-phosphate aldolase